MFGFNAGRKKTQLNHRINTLISSSALQALVGALLSMKSAASPTQGNSRNQRKRLIQTGLALALAVFLYANLPLAEWMANFDLYVATLGPAGPPLYGAGFAISVALFLPVLPFSLGAGALFGFWTGLIVAILGTTGGASLSFLLARTLLRAQVEKRISHHPTFHALDRAITQSGGRIVFMTRLAPIFPFSIINMAYGLTGVRTKIYVGATALGMIPTSAVFVFLGSTAADLATPEEDMIQTSLKIVGAVVTLIVIVLLTRFAQKAIREADIET